MPKKNTSLTKRPEFIGAILGFCIFGLVILFKPNFFKGPDACRCVEVFEADATGKSGSYWSPKDVEECESHYRSVALRRNKPEYWCAVDDCDNSKK